MSENTPLHDEPARADASRRLASLFVDSKLTPLIALVSLGLGTFAVLTTPREQDPTVSVPFIQVLAAWPGHGADEVDARLGHDVSAWMREIRDVEHVVSASVDDGTLVSIQFPAGVADETALSLVNARIAAHLHELPEGAIAPTVTLLGSDDVPAMSIVFYARHDDPRALRRVVREIGNVVERLPHVSTTRVIGGIRRELSVELDAVRLAAHGISAQVVAQAIRGAGVAMPIGALSGSEGTFSVRTHVAIRNARDLGALVVGRSASEVVRLRDVADVRDEGEDATSYVSHIDHADARVRHAVVLTVQKTRGANATNVTADIGRALESRQVRDLLGDRIHYRVVRDDGRTASAKVTVLLEHMLLATFVVMLVVGFALGFRASLIVGCVIPVTLAFVPFVYELTGFTLNRITLSAMIFAIGILVDDAIVIIENIHRRFELAGPEARTHGARIALDAVQEVGSPTILATATVIAALAPTAFARGMVGQFLRALPVGSSVAMLYSLFIALTLTPFLSYKLLRAEPGLHVERATPRWLARYSGLLAYFLAAPRRAALLGGLCVSGLVIVSGLLYTRVAVFRNMPVSDVDTMAVIVDMPAGTTLVDTHRAATRTARALAAMRDIESVQVYAGVGGPINFQGLARGYGTRTDASQAELQLTLSRERSVTSHELADVVRREVTRALARDHARVVVAEEPMGPPVNAALVAEIYAPDDATRTALADVVRRAFVRSRDVVDVQSSMTPSRPTLVLESDSEQLAALGIISPVATMGLRALLAGDRPMSLTLPGEPEAVQVAVSVPRAERSTPHDVGDLSVLDVTGRPVATNDFARTVRYEGRAVRLRKDLVPVVFVSGEMRGNGSAIYPMLDLSRELPRASGASHGVDVLWDDTVPRPEATAIRWAGEWTPTYEMNRDLGMAFIVVLFLIYLMLAAWYGSYATPFVVMLPIPLALVGVVPAHVVAGIPMSGMGTIGVIALAGLMVRNSILIVDFAREKIGLGMPIERAIALASHERIRPILLTAATVVLGDGVLYFDPMMQGLGLTMAAGALVSTMLTLVVVPVAYYWLAAWTTRAAK
jgi:multidrug efflux pump subunit AcrB